MQNNDIIVNRQVVGKILDGETLAWMSAIAATMFIILSCCCGCICNFLCRKAWVLSQDNDFNLNSFREMIPAFNKDDVALLADHSEQGDSL